MLLMIGMQREYCFLINLILFNFCGFTVILCLFYVEAWGSYFLQKILKLKLNPRPLQISSPTQYHIRCHIRIRTYHWKKNDCNRIYKLFTSLVLIMKNKTTKPILRKRDLKSYMNSKI